MINRRDLNYYKSLNYRIELFFEPEEKCWYAEFPELPGCLAHGATKEEALASAVKAKEAWLEATFESGRDIPEPRPEIEYSGRFLLRVPKSLHQELAEEAEREGTSINRLAIQILSSELKNRKFMKVVTDEMRSNVRNIIREEARTYFAQNVEPITTQISGPLDLVDHVVVVGQGPWRASGFGPSPRRSLYFGPDRVLRDVFEPGHDFDLPAQDPKKEAAA